MNRIDSPQQFTGWDDYEVGAASRKSDKNEDPIVGRRSHDFLPIRGPPPASTQRFLEYGCHVSG
jgi:hypothetical protein